MRDLYEFKIRTGDGRDRELWDLHGRVVMFTMLPGPGPAPQTQGLDQLVAMFGADGLEVVGVPADDGAAAGHDVVFDVIASADTPATAALVSWLLDELPGPFGTRVAQGYTKFLIGRDGRPVTRFEATAEAKPLIQAIRDALAAAVPPAPPRPQRSDGAASPSSAMLPVPLPPWRPEDDIVEAEIVAESSTEIVLVARVR